MKVWLDDRRPAPDPTWLHVTTPAQVIDLLETGEVTELSLDHDLALFEDDREITGYAVLAWLEEQVVVNGFTPPPLLTVHSANPPAHERMQRAIDAIRRRTSG
jgi:hypothetical protein